MMPHWSGQTSLTPTTAERLAPVASQKSSWCCGSQIWATGSQNITQLGKILFSHYIISCYIEQNSMLPYSCHDLLLIAHSFIQPFQGHNLSHALIARFPVPIWGPYGADRTQVGPMLAPWTLLSGWINKDINITQCYWTCEFGYIFHNFINM